MESDDDFLRRIERWRRAPRTRPERIPQPGPGQESVWDYPRPPRVERDPRRVRVEIGGVCLAESTDALRVLETGGPPAYYLPPAAVQTSLLEAAPGTTLCEWKGIAHYWSARLPSRGLAESSVTPVAWSYPDPFPEYAELADYLAFFPGRVDACFVAGERVSAQPGDYYGGWITRDILGPFKGDPGSEAW